ncbi:MAG: hypothetical protein ACREFY_17105 [Acetobacteraceae bacterium]
MDTIATTKASGSALPNKGPAPAAERGIPVFRGPTLVGFIDRPGDPESSAAAPATDGTRSQGPRTPETEVRTPSAIAGLRAENGVVRLAGEIDDPHDIPALRRIAASLPGTLMVIDDLWVACE